MRWSPLLQTFHSIWLVMILTWSKLASKTIVKCLINPFFAATYHFLYDIMMVQPSVLMPTWQTTSCTSSCLAPHPIRPSIIPLLDLYCTSYTFASFTIRLWQWRGSCMEWGQDCESVCCYYYDSHSRSCVGKALQGLADTNQVDNTLVIFTRSDNGTIWACRREARGDGSDTASDRSDSVAYEWPQGRQ